MNGGEQSPPPRIVVPAALSWWRAKPGGVEWLERIPRLVSECADEWGLEVEPAFAGAHVSFVAPARFADGTRVVLKIYFPGVWENEQEADALAHWEGRGAVQLLEHDPVRRALLVERCEPGTPLWTIADEDEAIAIATGVLRRLWRPAPRKHPFRLLADDAAQWADAFPASWERLGRPFEQDLVTAAVAAVRELAPTQGEPVVLHQDFHSGNVLRAEREPWLAIDPQPLVGEREFDAASLLRDRSEWLLGGSRPERRVRRRLDQLADELALDRERIRRWGVVHALAWGISLGAEKVEREMIMCARLLTSVPLAG